MLALNNVALLAAWEQALAQHPLDRSLTLLAAAWPGERRRSEWAALSVGERDRLLFALYGATFGPQVEAQAHCPECGAAVEFACSAPDLAALPNAAAGAVVDGRAGRYSFRARPPTSADVASAARLPPAAARRHLTAACLLELRRDDGEPTPVELATELPAEVVNALAEALAAADPLADIELALACPACGGAWGAIFDIGAFLWAAVNLRARRLIGEVHRLAQAYGWREEEILSMSAARRQLYLEMVS